MTTKILRGFCRAGAVTCTTSVMRGEVLRHQLVAPERLGVNPYGIGEGFNVCPDRSAEQEACRLLGDKDARAIEILHVGSTIARKRIDVLLRVFAALRREVPSIRLIRVGGEFTGTQRRLIEELGLPRKSMVVIPHLGHRVLPAVYRRAAVALLTSESEGFGIPVLESMACGTPVVVSDTPVLREVGGTAATYCPVANVERWTDTILDLLRERRERPNSQAHRMAAGVSWAAQFTWSSYAARAAQIYRKLVS